MLLSSLVFVASAHGSLGGQHPISMRYKFHNGESLHYKLSFDISMNMGGGNKPFNTTGAQDLTMKVSSVKPDGSATVTMQSSGGKSKPSSASMVMSPTGKVTNMSAGGTGSSMSSALSSMEGLNGLPQKPVSVGSTWDSSMNMGTGMGVSMRNKVDRIASVDGRTVVFYHSSGTIDLSKFSKLMPTGGGALGLMTFKIANQFDTSRGSMRATDGTVSSDMTIEAQGKKNHMKMNMSFKMKLAG